MAAGVSQLDDVIFQAPIAALQWEDLIDTLEQVGDCGIGVEGDIKDDSGFGEGMALGHEAETVAVLHG